MVRKIKKIKNITLDNLARMVAKGFEETATKTNLKELEKEMNNRFGEVNLRLERIEKILFWEYKERIERLEDQVKELQADFRQLT
jgi:archaellum component FlaC